MNSDVFSGVGQGTWARAEKRLRVQAMPARAGCDEKTEDFRRDLWRSVTDKNMILNSHESKSKTSYLNMKFGWLKSRTSHLKLKSGQVKSISFCLKLNALNSTSK